MFALLPLIIAIILAGVVATSMAYSGGDIFTESNINSKANAIINEGRQIRQAAEDYRKVYGSWPSTLNDLVSDTPPFLSHLPRNTYSIDSSNGTVTSADPMLNKKVCGEIQNMAVGFDAPGASQSNTQKFGCYGASSPYNFYFQ